MATGVCIYGLFDPRDGKIRYVGKTKGTIANRLRSHKSGQSGVRCANWINKLKRDGVSPGICCLEVCPEERWVDRERLWIAYFRSAGSDLCNISDGGDGPNGFRHTDDAKRRIGIAGRGRKNPAASAKRRGVPLTAEHRAAISAAKKGRVVISDEQRRKTSATLMGRKFSEERKARLRNKPAATPEHRAKLSEAAKRQWATGRGYTAKRGN